jgi:putative ABC transport system substrate-binding protein
MYRLVALVASLALLAGALPAASAQQPAADAKRVGFLGPSGGPNAPPLLDILRKTLATGGRVDGKDVVIESRWPPPDRLDRLPESVAELLALKPAVILAIGATAARAAMAAAGDVPVVYAVVVDPVATGLAASMQRPGKNATGVTSFDPEHARRQIELLKFTVLDLKRIAVLGDDGAAAGLSDAVEQAARAEQLEVTTHRVARAKPDFGAALDAAKAAGAQAVVVLSTPVTTPHRKAIAEAALQRKLPTLAPRDHADAAPLLSYGVSFADATRRAAGQVDRILGGAKAGDLPVESAGKPELILNLQTAKALGMAMPPPIMGMATQRIE